jgi:hypothetical protein
MVSLSADPDITIVYSLVKESVRRFVKVWILVATNLENKAYPYHRHSPKKAALSSRGIR